MKNKSLFFAVHFAGEKLGNITKRRHYYERISEQSNSSNFLGQGETYATVPGKVAREQNQLKIGSLQEAMRVSKQMTRSSNGKLRDIIKQLIKLEKKIISTIAPSTKPLCRNAQCKFLVGRSCQICPPHKNGHNSFNFHPRSPRLHMEVDLYLIS